MPYKVADGHDIAEESLATISPQPRSEGIKATRRVFCPDGTVQDDGRYVELVWDLVGDATDYQSLLNQFGVQSATTNEVTVLVRDETFAWVRMNGTAVRPSPGNDVSWRDFFPRGVTILIKDLVAAT